MSIRRLLPLPMDIFLQQIVNGLTLGSIYALVALGYTMVYGIMGLINFAHGEVVMIGALSSLAVFNQLLALGMPEVPAMLCALIVAIIISMALGLLMERFAYRPLRNAPRLASLITAIGVSIVLQQLAMLFWGRHYHAVPEILSSHPISVFGASITEMKIIIIVVTATTMIALSLFIMRTRLGRAMRATAESPTIAALMGVNVDRMIQLTFVIGSALAALAGVLISSNYGIAHYSMGSLLGLKAFTAAVLGGIGNIAGAMLGGILLGLIEAIGAGYLGSWTNGMFGINYKDVIAFLVLIIVLIFRPSGLLGEKVVDRP